MSIRVTDQMIQDRENVGGYPFIRIVKAKDDGMVEVQRAVRATPPGNGRLDWKIDEWAEPIVRFGTEEELHELEAMRSVSSRAIQTKMHEVESTAGMLYDLGRIRESQELAAAAAVCGFTENPEGAQPCSDEDEQKCPAGPVRILTIADVLARTRQRPPSCPRRRAWMASKALSQDEVKGRSVRRRIPSDVLRLLLGPKSEIQERPALLEARKWAKSDRSFLVLCASNGAGKSFAVGSWLNSLSKGGLFLTQFDIRNAIIPDPEDRAYSLIRQASESHALVIDNVEGSVSDAVKEIIEGLVIKFHGAGKKIAMTTSLGPDRFLNLWRVNGTKTGPVFERLIKYGTITEVPPWENKA